MKRIFTLVALTLALSLLMCACAEKKQTDGDGTSASAGGTQQTIEPTSPKETDSTQSTDADVEDDVDSFREDNFPFKEDDGYEYKEEVAGKPVTEYGVYEEGKEGQTYIPGTPDAPTVSAPLPVPDPTEPTDSEPTPTDPPSTEPTEPGSDPTEPPFEEPDPTPVPPKDAYASSIAAMGDYTADVRFMCEVELSDGTVTKYVYKYRVARMGDDYTATYTEKGEQKTASFRQSDGVMIVDGNEKSASLKDFYRFCSMVDPIPLSLYYYEHSEAGTDVSARLAADDHRAMLLNISPLFSGFDKMDGITMGSLYYNGHMDAEGVYNGTDITYDMSLTDSILGLMKFRVGVEVDYVY